jgi:hypothetical protein
MEDKMINRIKKHCDYFQIEGVTRELILIANKEIKKDICRPLKIIDKLQFELEMCQIMVIQNDFLIGTLICNSQTDTEQLNLPLLQLNNLNIIVEPLKEIAWGFSSSAEYISNSLWSCSCKKEYIHSKLNPICDVCKKTIKPISDFILMFKNT